MRSGEMGRGRDSWRRRREGRGEASTLESMEEYITDRRSQFSLLVTARDVVLARFISRRKQRDGNEKGEVCIEMIYMQVMDPVPERRKFLGRQL